MSAHDPKRIVIIDPAFMGDVIFNAPLVREIRRSHPDAHLGLLVRPPFDEVAQFIPGVNVLHVFDKRGSHSGLAGLMRMAKELRRERYTRALIPHPSVRSTALAWLAKIPERLGIASGLLARAFLTERRLPRADDTFVSERLGLWDSRSNGAVHLGRSDLARTALERTDLERAETIAGSLRRAPARERPTGSPPRVGLVLGSNWETKRWPLERAFSFVQQMVERGVLVRLLGSESERWMLQVLERRHPHLRSAIEDAMGGPVSALADAIADCDVVVAGDTGPLHLARGLGIPVVALFGPTPEARHAFTPEDVVLTVNIDCRPCSAHGQRRCPLRHHRCLVDLQEGLVTAAVLNSLQANARFEAHS